MPRYSSRYYSRSRWSDWSGFSLRLVGSLVVFAVAALSGAVIGGVSIYLINDAATPPPSAVANSDPTPALTNSATTSTPAPPQQAPAAATNGRPVRVVDPAFPPPSPAESKPAAPAATATATQPPAENLVSSAAPPAQPTASQPAPVQPQSPPASATASQPPAQPQSPPASATASQPPAQENLQTTAHDAATHEAATQDAATQAAAPETSEHANSPRKAARKRVTGVRQPAYQPSPQNADQAQSTTRRTFYDYYDRDNDQQRASATEPDNGVRTRPDPRDPRARSSGQTQQRIIVRRQDNYDVRRQDNYDRDDRYGQDNRDADRRFPAQPQPAQPLFGFFGGDRRDGSWHDDRD